MREGQRGREKACFMQRRCDVQRTHEKKRLLEMEKNGEDMQQDIEYTNASSVRRE